MPRLNALIAGSTGYIGIQLVKLLLKHKNINIKYLCGNSSKGKSIYYFDKSLKNKKLPKITKFQKNYLNEVDVVFTALPNGEAQNISNNLSSKNILIDLSADFRLKKASEYLKWYKINHKSKSNIKNSIYALPEIKKKIIKKYKIISCPGCYPTSVHIPLIPLIEKKMINSKNITIDSKSGYSGAGRKLKNKSKYKNLFNSVSAYGVGSHRHTAEIDQEFSKISKKKIRVFFTPHIIPMFRGILSTIYLETTGNNDAEKIHKYLKNYHKNNFFVKIAKFNTPIGTGSVMNTNYCNISVCKNRQKNRIIIISTIDNLIKGASGQAVQNMNVAYKFRETMGLL